MWPISDLWSLISKNPSITISIASLAISLYTLWRQRKRITISFDPALFVLDPKKDILVLNEPYPFASDVAFWFTIHVINPSNVNLSFFDLRVFDPDTNKNHFILTKKTMVENLSHFPIHLRPYGPDGYTADIPEHNYGSIKAGDVMRLDIIVIRNLDAPLGDELTVSLKVPTTSIFHRSLFSNTDRKIYRAYEHTYSLSGWEKVLAARNYPQEPTQKVDNRNNSNNG